MHNSFILMIYLLKKLLYFKSCILTNGNFILETKLILILKMYDIVTTLIV